MLACSVASAANIVVINDDPPGVGFNDDRYREPTDGNPENTLGERRLVVFQHAADLLGRKIQSGVTIRVRASFAPLECDANSAALGQAGPTISLVNFGAGRPDTAYPIALTNALVGRDLLPQGNGRGAPEADIGAEFNGDIDNNPTCLRNIDWYYGVDGDPPEGTLGFLSTVTHELIHGLGFIAFTELATGRLPDNGFPGIFDRFILDLDRNARWPELTAQQRAESSTNAGCVVFDGPRTNRNGALSIDDGVEEGHILLHTPDSLEGRSSVSHWNTNVTPNALMEPQETGDIDVNNGIGLASCVLTDIGWTLTDGTSCPDGRAPGFALPPGTGNCTGTGKSNGDAGADPDAASSSDDGGGSGGGGCVLSDRAQPIDPLFLLLMAIAACGVHRRLFAWKFSRRQFIRPG